MSVLKHIAYFQNRRDEVPNQQLAQALAEKKDKKGIREIADHVWDENPAVQSDCLKVLYEIGYLDPSLITNYADDFLQLLRHKNNRLVWGSMIALSTLAEIKADEIYAHTSEIQKVMEKGSVIIVDNGVKILAIVASKQERYRRKLLPYLLEHLKTCRPKEVPQHAEKSVVAVNAKNKAQFIQVLEKRMTDMTSSGAARLKRVIKEAERR